MKKRGTRALPSLLINKGLPKSKRSTRALPSLLINKSLPKSKRSQITVFIIVGVLIVSIIALFFILRSGVIPEIGGGHETNPDAFLESCLEDKIKETVKTISLQGGYITNPLNITFKFSDENEYSDISYLCYNQNSHFRCINQEPVLIQHLKDEIEEGIKAEVENCFTELKESLKNERYAVDATYKGFEVELIPRKIIVEINADMTLTKTEESLRYENFTIITASKFYDLAIVVQEIVSQEAEHSNFDELGFMIIYPEFKIIKFNTGDSRIYRVKDKKTQEEFKFAIRTSVIPPRL